MQDVYDKRFYLQAIIDYLSGKFELGIVDVHWSDDDADSIAIVTETDLITLSAQDFPGLGGKKDEDMSSYIRNRITCTSAFQSAWTVYGGTGAIKEAYNMDKAEMLDAYLAINGWQLQAWLDENHHLVGYQLYYGEGVQVDNQYEYGFPHLLDLEDLIVTLSNWKIDKVEKYQGTICHKKDAEIMEVCPVCGYPINPCDGEEDGYGELHLNWTCDGCGSEGYAIIDTQNQNSFEGHTVTEKAIDYYVGVEVTGHVNCHVKATNTTIARKSADRAVSEMDFGPLQSIDWDWLDVVC